MRHAKHEKATFLSIKTTSRRSAWPPLLVMGVVEAEDKGLQLLRVEKQERH